jgi:transglutaminase-like putative cysteine protease
MTLLRFLRRLASADVMGLLLILTAVQAFTYGVSSSLRNTDTRYFFWICAVAVLIALELSRLNLNGIQTSVCMIVLGILGIWIIAAQLAVPLLSLGRAILHLLPQLVPTLHSQFPIDASSLEAPLRSVAAPSHDLSLRVQGWLISANKGETLNDGLVRSMIWTLILWLFAAWIGWFAGRRNAVAALLPSIALLAAVTSYSEHRVYTLWVMVSVLLLLMGIWNYKNHTMQWERKKVDYSDSIRYDLSQSVIFLTLAIGAVAFFTPSVSWRDVRDFWRELNQPKHNEAADILGVQPAPVTTKKIPAQKPFLPREHLLSEGFAQSEKIVMTIRTGELPPIVSSTLTADPPRYYWRSVTYDTYVGAGWFTSSAPPQKFPANTPLIPGLLKGYKTLHLDVKLVEPEGKLFWSGILFSANVPFTVNWRVRPQSSLFGDQATLLQADMFAALSNTTAYKAESYVPLATVKKLREASTNYPEAIQQRYLQLPDLTPRVRQLAEALTRNESNPYDKAKAIESYLRKTYPYDLNIPAPPEDQDVADYFLFDLRRGYCDYYATAMVVLARASGIPARFVSGYSSGGYDAANAQYVVRELNAHSWVEIYFPEIGWVEFEPTASEPEIERSLTDEAALAQQTPDSTAQDLLNRFRIEKTIDLVAPIAIIFISVLLYYSVIEGWRYLRLAPGLAIEKIVRKLYRQGRSLAGERTRAETAYEFKQKLVDRMDTTGKKTIIKRLLFRARNDVELLTDLYQATLFRQNDIQKNDVKKALKAWKHLRIRLLIARMNAYYTNVILSSVKNLYQHVMRLFRRNKRSLTSSRYFSRE